MARPEHRDDSLRVKKLRNFLMRNPRPTVVRVTTEDGDNDYQITDQLVFATLAEQLDSLDPSKIVAYDAEGKPIRAWRESDMAPQVRSGAMLETPEGLKGDPQALMLLHFGNLLARAYEHATDTAFERLANILETVMDDNRERNERLKAMEELYFSAMHANADLQAAAAQAGQDPVDFQQQMIANFFQTKEAAGGGKKKPRVVDETPEEAAE